MKQFSSAVAGGNQVMAMHGKTCKSRSALMLKASQDVKQLSNVEACVALADLGGAIHVVLQYK